MTVNRSKRDLQNNILQVYILSFKVLDIIGVKHSQSWAKYQGFRPVVL